uniref:Uncharacterized protein n=1 Tax=Parascaris equorum TaxID=6256 RepID=A0A914RR80_PAREQ
MFVAGRVMQTTRRAPLGEVANSPATPSFTRASSVPAHKRPPVAVTAKNTGKAGGVSDEAFQQAFVQVPKCDVGSFISSIYSVEFQRCMVLVVFFKAFAEELYRGDIQ